MNGSDTPKNLTSRAPMVSVIIPAFNSSQTLPATLRSVLDQSFRDWEAIVVDDCSIDDLSGALGDLMHDPRIRIIRHEVNSGASAARNTGIREARGRFLAFLDADDAWAPEKLHLQLDAVQASERPDETFCVTQTVIQLTNARSIIRPKRPKRPEESLAEFIFVDAGFCQTSSFFVSRDMALKVGFRDLPTGEDHAFAIDICDGHGAKYHLIEQPLAFYNDEFRPGRLSNDKSLASGDKFMSELQGVLSRKALLAYETRYLGVAILHRSPLKGSALILKALRGGAISPRFTASLIARAIVPTGLYHAIRARFLGA